MEAYTNGLVVLTLLAILHSGSSTVTEISLTEGNTFTFRCDVVAKGALELFSSPLKYYYINTAKGEGAVQLSLNSESLKPGWTPSILKPSNDTYFPFQLAGTVTLADSGTYYCTRENFNKTVVLTVKELTLDVGRIDFSISAIDEFGVPSGEEFLVTRMVNGSDPIAKEIHIDSGYYQVRCTADGGIPAPTYTLNSGDNPLEFGSMKTVLINSGLSDLSCHVENGKFMHHLQFDLKINPGHPNIICEEPVTVVGATDAEIDCVVSGKELKCSYFDWLSEMDMTSFKQKANYSVECEVNENRMQMKNVLKFNMIKKSDFDDGFILKFENHLSETFQIVNKLKKKAIPGALNGGNNAVPMGTFTLMFLSMIALLL
ncbi:uncharacterized protein LOC110461783 [Mizuhopecten yessoensis]|uniref:uncharacterized protein LOC110461783 n=1 Tax=Mizuhopecten yessoensis TaxID=6573 RepID=UPI000B45F03A|nr:uncharacterized protein LOC110461783 [Mizuhopecten yessoensis]XP_021371119.1 uncharacterized protein LOC110461783 [Mizuhopecten yessoensis]XP_021371120.1 uncharacterized protein LOC110461783 [Mizuhopecten yessoensis]XP_021371121.1 uncharacterized protein LOC110461783 [Mizuhopecten yessoensis]XP_021371122.1 uncharacterized protein LOC110461783 [Mizuhopecten yessoensis]